MPGQTTSIQFLHVFAELGNGAVYRPSNLPVGQFQLKYDVVWFVREARRPGLLASAVQPLKRV